MFVDSWRVEPDTAAPPGTSSSVSTGRSSGPSGGATNTSAACTSRCACSARPCGCRSARATTSCAGRRTWRARAPNSPPYPGTARRKVHHTQVRRSTAHHTQIWRSTAHHTQIRRSTARHTQVRRRRHLTQPISALAVSQPGPLFQSAGRVATCQPQ